MDKADYLEIIEAESELLLAACSAVPLDTPIAHCDGWTNRDLLAHIGMVWDWASANAVGAGEKAPRNAAPPDDDNRVVEWAAGIRATLIERLWNVDSAALAWSFAADNQTAGFWHRRQAVESSIHRWDVQNGTGTTTPLAPAFAADAIDEWTRVALRYAVKPGQAYPSKSLHIHCTDTAGEWLIVGNDGNDFTVSGEHAKGDVEVKGTAEALLLWIWGRPGPDITLVGDESMAARWEGFTP